MTQNDLINYMMTKPEIWLLYQEMPNSGEKFEVEWWRNTDATGWQLSYSEQHS